MSDPDFGETIEIDADWESYVVVVNDTPQRMTGEEALEWIAHFIRTWDSLRSRRISQGNGGVK